MKKLPVLCSLFVSGICVGRNADKMTKETPPSKTVRVEVDLEAVRHKMDGGIGASWHAMSREFRIQPGDMHGWKDTLNSRGSAWGGNPPIEWEDAWNQIHSHAAWLGMNWIRVEFSQRMYEATRGRFDWDNEEMQALYRILDSCERNNADVFLTQMWSFVDWNNFDGVHPLQSAPRSVTDFAQGIATAVEHLVKDKRYTCIRWLCIVNEPNLSIGWWLGPDKKPMTIVPALKAVREELDKRGINISLSAPDWNNLGLGPTDVFDPHTDIELGAYDAHNYGGPNPKAIAQMTEWVERARKRSIPFFLSEFGDMRLGWKYRNPGPKSYAAALSNAETMLRGIRIGVDGFNRWSFTNRGDLDGQWQLIRTWDAEKKGYLKQIQPEPIPYYSFGILTRFCAKYSAVLNTRVIGSEDVVAETLRSPKGNLTVYVLNKAATNQSLTLQLQNVGKAYTFYRYQTTESAIQRRDFKLDPEKKLSLSAATRSFQESLAPRSITVFSTYDLAHSDPGITVD